MKRSAVVEPLARYEFVQVDGLVLEQTPETLYEDVVHAPPQGVCRTREV